MPWISKAKLAELNGYVDVYGGSLEQHHGSKVTCEDVRKERDSLRTEVAGLKRKLSAVGRAALRVTGDES